jgi:hypothetical protein
MRLPRETSRYSKLTIADVSFAELIISAGHSTEDRGQLPLWREIAVTDPSRVVWVAPSGENCALVSHEATDFLVSLNDDRAIGSLFAQKKILLDISGLPHSVWAPLLRVAYANKVCTRVLYAEPDSYREHPNPVSASRFDLSVTLQGLAPLPGFARLSGPPDENKCLFVALLGFEGNRPECLIVQIEPTPRVIPIIGVPGFQIEYPAFTVACNRDFLDGYRAHSDIRYARASCPFELMVELEEVARDYPDHYLYLAPVGTKPHALGAIIFSLQHPDSTEILFDHPVRRPGRTKGVGLMHVYDFGCFSAS